MEFKIDTKPTYTVIAPDSDNLSVNLAEEIRQKVMMLRAEGSQNIIVDLSHCNTMDVSAGNVLLDLHQSLYDQDCSLVFCHLNDNLTQVMKQGQYHLSLNLTPSLIEAIDIISMEVLERDLLDETSN
jgi:anti-anti-sigma factor